MSVRAAGGPVVTATTIEFSFASHDRAVVAVALAHELRRPRRIPFRPVGKGRFELAFPLPEADRLEYLLELIRRDGSRELVPDPANPLRAAGPFGDKSVVELRGYEPPAWLDDEDSEAGEVRELPLRLPARLWSAADTDPQQPLPLLVVHDGPEYAGYAYLLRFLDHCVAFGELPPLRAALLPPPGDRNESYSASTRYARALAGRLLPAALEAAPTERLPVGVGASLGALALLHADWLYPGRFAGLYLQSGSYFRQRFDRQESGFPRFGRISRFVGSVLAGRAAPPACPVTVTCGTAEENLDNNRAVAAALAEQGAEVRLVENRDAHTWTGWRDTFAPHLVELLLHAWT